MSNSSSESDSKLYILLGVFLATSLLSVISQLFIMIFYILYTDLTRRKNFTYRLILLLSFSDIIVWGMRIESNLEKIITLGTPEDFSHDFCVFLAYIWNFFLLLNILTTLLISVCLMMEVIFHKDSQKYEYLFYIFIVLYSGLFSATPLFGNGYGVADDIKCWITASEYDFRYLAFYGHLWGVFIFNCINIVIIFCKLRRLGEVHVKLVKKLVCFPILMLIFWLEPSIRRIFDPDDKEYSLELLQYIFMPSQGIANAIVYGLVNRTVKNKILDFFKGNWRNLRRISHSLIRPIETPGIESEEEDVQKQNTTNLGDYDGIIFEVKFFFFNLLFR